MSGIYKKGRQYEGKRMKNIVIAIDGVCYSGKSAIAEQLADDLGFLYVNTGILYRFVAYMCLIEGHKPEDRDFRGYISELSKKIRYTGKELYFNDIKIEKNEKLKSEAHAKITSIYAESKIIRDKLTDMIRFTAEGKSVVADGKDCGTHIFPDADYKFYFDISGMIRIQKWLTAIEQDVKKDEIRHGITSFGIRDRRDKSRDYCPLRIAADAYVFQLDNLSVEAAKEKAKKIILTNKDSMDIQKDSKKMRQRRKGMKGVHLLSNISKRNVVKVKNPRGNKIMLGRAHMRFRKIIIRGTGNCIKIKGGGDISNLKILVRGNDNRIVR